MTKLLPAIAGALLGLMFVAFGSMYFLEFGPEPPAPPEGSPQASFMGALAPTGYLSFVKAMEILGGALVAIPRARNLGLLILGPIVVNIFAYHVFLTDGAELTSPILLAIAGLMLVLVIAEHRAFLGLWTRPHAER